MARRTTGMTLMAMLAGLGMFLIFAGGMLTDHSLEAKEPVMFLIIGLAIAGTVALRGPVGRALARLLESSDTDGEVVPEAVEARLQQLEHQVAEAQLERGRVFDLEERLDFAERLLAEKREPRELPR